MAWDLLNEPFNNLDDWTDSSGGGSTSQTTFDGKETLKLDSGPNTGFFAWGSTVNFMDSVGDIVIDLEVYADAIGTYADRDRFRLQHSIFTDDTLVSCVKFAVYFASDGLFIYDGANYNEVGTDLVEQNKWQTWRFYVKASKGATASCDVYLDGKLKESSVDCSDISEDSEVLALEQSGYTTPNRITYVNHLKIKTPLATKIHGITPKKIYGIHSPFIANINGVT